MILLVRNTAQHIFLQWSKFLSWGRATSLSGTKINRSLLCNGSLAEILPFLPHLKYINYFNEPTISVNPLNLLPYIWHCGKGQAQWSFEAVALKSSAAFSAVRFRVTLCFTFPMRSLLLANVLTIMLVNRVFIEQYFSATHLWKCIRCCSKNVKAAQLRKCPTRYCW